MSEETITADETTRRDFIYVASGMLGVVGVAGLAWPFIDQMRPGSGYSPQDHVLASLHTPMRCRPHASMGSAV